MKFINCQNCSKKLLKIGQFDSLSIKCSRCKTLNHLSVTNAPQEAHEAHITQGNPRGKTLQQSPSALYRAET